MAAADIATSLAQEDIPIKLRCASCNNLVVNAFRLPCCDQNVCESCQASLPDSCPICMHSPLSAEDCKPNKSLRLTVKAFLKNEEKKRDKDKPSATQNATVDEAAQAAQPSASTALGDPDTTAPAKSKDTQEQAGNQEIQESADVDDGGVGVDDDDEDDDKVADASDSSSSVEITLDVPVSETEQAASADREHAPHGPKQYASRQSSTAATPFTQAETQQFNEGIISAEGSDQQQMFGSGFGLDSMSNFGNWANPGGHNPMMGVQPGMQMAAWQGFPNMMGMPGMGMDPMMMNQGMFGGFNGQGMGMHGMNMGIGFDGSFGGWVGDSTMGMMGMSSDFGATAGYYPSVGYNQQSHQGHFNQMHQQQYPIHNYKQNRFPGQAYHRAYDRDQGRYPGHFQSRPPMGPRHADGHFNHQQPHNFQREFSLTKSEDQTGIQNQELTSLSKQTVEGSASKILDREAQDQNQAAEEGNSGPSVGTEGESSSKNLNELPDRSTSVAADTQQQSLEDGEKDDIKSDPSALRVGEDVPQPISTIDTTELSVIDVNVSMVSETLPPAFAAPSEPAAEYAVSTHLEIPAHGQGYNRGFGRGTHEARGNFRGRISGRPGGFPDNPSLAAGVAGVPSEPKGQGVAGAPTGPKAMRDGLPNTGFRGRGGFQIAGRGAKAVPTALGRSAPPPASVNSRQAAPQSPLRSGSIAPAQPQARPNWSPSASDNDNSNLQSESKGRRHRRSRRSENDGLNENGEDETRRTRESSVESASKRRHHRNKERTRSSRSGVERSSNRGENPKGRRQRSGSEEHEHPAANGDPQRGSHVDRHRSKRESTERDRSKRSRYDRSASPNTDRGHSDRPRERSSQPEKTVDNKTQPREFKIKDRSKWIEREARGQAPKKEDPYVDQHTLEREARNRERLMKEQQRRESITVGNDRKRSRMQAESISYGEADRSESRNSRRKLKHEESGSRRDRKLSYQYEEDEDEEERALRIESEREAARWD